MVLHAGRYSVYPTGRDAATLTLILDHDTRVFAALAKGVGGGPAFQGDPGPLLNIYIERAFLNAYS